MAFKEKDLIKVPGQIDRWFRKEKIEPFAKEKYRGHTYYLAEGGPFFDGKNVEADQDYENRDPDFYKNGYYVAAFCYMCVNEGYNIRTPFGLSLHFPFNHDLNHTQESRKDLRINSIRRECKIYMDRQIDDPENHLLERIDRIILPKESSLILPGNA